MPIFAVEIFMVLQIIVATLALLPAQAAPSTYSNITELSYRARERFDAEPKNAEAAYNFAVYQSRIGDRQYAQQIFSQAVALKPDDFLSHLGLGQMLANNPACGAKVALVELARAEALALAGDSQPLAKAALASSRPAQLDLLGQTYLAIGYPQKALPLYQQAYALQPNNRQILQMLVRSALAAKNIKVAAAHLKALTAGSVTDRQLLLGMAASGASLSTQVPLFVFDQAKANFGGEAELFYGLGRNFEASNCLSLASKCYSTAVVLAPDEGQYVLAHCARLVQEGKRQAAIVQLNVIASKLPGQEPSPRRAAVAGTVAAGLKLLNGGLRSYKTSLMEFSHLSCNCKIAAFNYLLRRLPGVVYARIAEGKGPHNLVIYDPAVASPEKIWANLGRDVTYKIVPELSRKIVDFPTLVKTALANYELQPDLERKYYEFQSLPILPISPR